MGLKNRIILVATILLILLLTAIDAAFTARSLIYSYQSEIAYLKQQQEANTATINYLVDQTFYLREVVRRGNGKTD